MYGQVPEEDGMGLDAVAFLIVVGGIKQLPRKVGPLSSDSFAVQFPHLDQELLKRENTAGVDTLQDKHTQPPSSPMAQAFDPLLSVQLYNQP